MKILFYIFAAFLFLSCTIESSDTEIYPASISVDTVIDEAIPEVLDDEDDINITTEVNASVVVAETNTDMNTEEDAIEAPASFHTYTNWSTFLKEHVSPSGKVNYAKIKQHKSQLASIIKEFQANTPGSNWSKNQKLAYWINVYNLFTVKLVADNYPVSSIKKITAEPWLKKFIKIGGKTYSLNDVENNIIRARFNEPRIHFALNCASASCPKLLNKAFRPDILQSQLTAQTKVFLADKSKNDFSDPKSIRISAIFNWYKADFEKNGSSVVSFINKYRSQKLSSPKVSYMKYSWELND